MWRKARQETVTGVEVAAGPAVLLQRLSSRVRLKKQLPAAVLAGERPAPQTAYFIYIIYI